MPRLLPKSGKIRNRVIFITGPTAAGKSRAAVCLARKIGAEIISCDSMQVYKGMDILTSKPPAALRKRVPHHLIDIIAPGKEYNVSLYRRDALEKIRDILGRGKTPLFVGGTGLYISILLDGIFDLKAQSKDIRNRLYAEAQEHGASYLYTLLKEADPQAALKIHPNDTKRVVRALEVFKATGQPISKLQRERKGGLWDEYEVTVFCLDMERERLYKKIDERVDKMFAAGLIQEVKKLAKLKLSKTARYAIGIGELEGYFKGRYDLEEAKRLVKRNSRQYAKRQLTWFRKDKRIKWVSVSNDTPEGMAKKLWKRLY